MRGHESVGLSEHMVNHLSRGLLAMSMFAALSWATGSRVVDYPLFLAGVAAIMLADITGSGRLGASSRKVGSVVCMVASLLCFILVPRPLTLVKIIPVALCAVLLADMATFRKKEDSETRSNQKTMEDPVASLCLSLPSAVALIAILALS